MTIGYCRECKAKVSSEAKVCPSCGVPNPYRPKRIGVLGWLGAGFVGILAFTMCSPSERPATSASTPGAGSQSVPAAKTASQIELEKRLALQKLKPQELRPILADKLLPVCQRSNPSLNYIKVEVRGTALFCVHTFYSEHSLKIGPLGPAISAWMEEWTAELRHAGVKRVGVYGTGEFASGSWFKFE